MFKSFLKKILLQIPFPVWKILAPRDEIVFYYHTVSDAPLIHIKHIIPYKNIRMFRNDTEYLRSHFNLAGLGGAEKEERGRQKAFLTFDDGFKECYTIIAPILKEYNIGAIFFVNTDFTDNRALAYRSKVSLCMETAGAYDEGSRGNLITGFNSKFGTEFKEIADLKRFLYGIRADRLDLLEEICRYFNIDSDAYVRKYRPYLDIEQIKSLSGQGFIIGAHGKDHRDFNLLNPKEIEMQMVDSCAEVKEITGQKTVPFSFPFGMGKLDKNLLIVIANRNPIIGRMYGIGGLSLDPPFCHRVCADVPGGEDYSTIPAVLKEEYAYYVYRKLFKVH